MENIKQDIKKLIIDTLNLEDITVDDIEDDLPLFSEEGLGLDSIDALELGVVLQKKYNLQISTKKNAKTREIFETVTSLTNFITDPNNSNNT